MIVTSEAGRHRQLSRPSTCCCVRVRSSSSPAGVSSPSSTWTAHRPQTPSASHVNAMGTPTRRSAANRLSPGRTVSVRPPGWQRTSTGPSVSSGHVSASDKLGRYWLLERIALGGMAEIHLAFVQGAAGFDRVVVLKVLRRDLIGEADHVEMFLTEARTIARLNHPNIVHAHELEEADGTWFIAMEHVAGSSFRELLVKVRRRGELVPPDVAVGLLLQACAGAHAAHELLSPAGEPLGLVHRDISPDNLMVRGDGHVKLLDFGIAKLSESTVEQTRQGTLKGKIAYMSPEQCRQGLLDRRSDVFSLGVVAWELLAATRLFKRESDFASMQAIVGGDVLDLRAARPGLPKDLVDAIHKALAPDAEQRHPTAEALRRVLQDIGDAHGWDTSVDRVGAFVNEHLGEEQSARARELEAAITRALDGPDDLDLESEEVEPPTPSDARPRRGLLAGVLGVALGTAGVLWWLTSQPPAGPPLHIGLAPVMDATPYLAAHEGMRQHLERRLDRPVVLVPHDSYGALGDALVDGSVDLASLPPKLYLETAERADVQVLAFKEVDGGSTTDSVLLVRESDTAGSVEDLRGQTLCFTDPASTTGYALPRAALIREGLAPDQYEARYSGNHLQALRDVLAGDCRAAATYADILRSADAADVTVGQLRVLALTGRSPQDAICARGELAAADAEALTQALTAFDPRGRGKRHVENITGFAPGSDAAYDDLRGALHAPDDHPAVDAVVPGL